MSYVLRYEGYVPPERVEVHLADGKTVTYVRESTEAGPLLAAGGTGEREPGVWHKDGPLAQVESMARWAERIADDPFAYSVREDAGKIAKNLRAAVAALAFPSPVSPAGREERDGG